MPRKEIDYPICFWKDQTQNLKNCNKKKFICKHRQRPSLQKCIGAIWRNWTSQFRKLKKKFLIVKFKIVINSVVCPGGSTKILNLTNPSDFTLTPDLKIASVNATFKPRMIFEEFCIDLVSFFYSLGYIYTWDLIVRFWVRK
jgi:hypothetical protein